MSRLIDGSAQYLRNALTKMRPGVADMVRFDKTPVKCWRCDGCLETYYCENRTYVVRCERGCAGVFLVDGKNPAAAAESIAGQNAGGGVSVG